jgi:CRISPR-associated protein Csx10
MNELHYCIELLSDVVITADAATAGGHQGLNYLPGSLFLGAAVAKTLKNGLPFDPNLFISGRVRFLAGYPEIEGQSSFPIPLSFHQIKGEVWQDRKPINRLIETADETLIQWRDGYMSPDGAVMDNVSRATRIKSAIDRESRRSAEGQLFSYDALSAGITFRTCIQTDDNKDADSISDLLKDNVVRLGRSRSAEYGIVKLIPMTNPNASTCIASSNDSLIHLLLVSDLACEHAGMPTLCPEAADFYLPKGTELVPEKTFLRTRRYAPWNSFFNTRMMERQVICKGGVLTFRLPKNIDCDLGILQKKLSSGIGLYREEGLGQILANPPWLLNPPILREPVCPPKSIRDKPIIPSNSILIPYLQAKHARKAANSDAFKLGIQWAEEWFALQKKISKAGQKTPGKSQWASIRGIAGQSKDEITALSNNICTFCNNGLRRKTWVDAIAFSNNQDQCLLQAIQEKLKDSANRSVRLALFQAASEMVRKLGRDQNKKKKEVSSR